MFIKERLMEIQCIVPGHLIIITLIFVKASGTASAFCVFVGWYAKVVAAVIAIIQTKYRLSREIFQEIKFSIYRTDYANFLVFIVFTPVCSGIGVFGIPKVRA